MLNFRNCVATGANMKTIKVGKKKKQSNFVYMIHDQQPVWYFFTKRLIFPLVNWLYFNFTWMGGSWYFHFIQSGFFLKHKYIPPEEGGSQARASTELQHQSQQQSPCQTTHLRGEPQGAFWFRKEKKASCFWEKEKWGRGEAGGDSRAAEETRQAEKAQCATC